MQRISLLRIFICCCFVSMLLVSSCKRAPLPPPVVLFDQGHGQHFLVDQDGPLNLTQFGQVFKEQGFEVRAMADRLSERNLHGIAALIISGPFKPLEPEEIGAIIKYVEEGGQLCVMLHIGMPVLDLLTKLGVAVANAPVHEQDRIINANPKDFYVDGLPDHPLTKEVDRIAFFGTWPLNTGQGANVIAKTGPKAWVDLNRDGRLGPGDAEQEFQVMVTGQRGHGHFVVIGDDATFQNRFFVDGNRKLAENLANWFKEGSYYR